MSNQQFVKPISRGKAIFLNGPTSAGKTSIAKFLQTKLSQPYMHIGIDAVIEMMPKRLNNWEGEVAAQGFSWKKEIDQSGNLINHLRIGPYAEKIAELLKDIVVTILDNGLNVIVDEVCLESKGFEKWKKKLLPYSVLYVGVKAPLEILESREKARENRIDGSARAQYRIVHQNNQYDLEIDTSTISLEKAVEIIIKQIEHL